MKRLRWKPVAMAMAVPLVALSVLAASLNEGQERPQEGEWKITVHRGPDCPCCDRWMEHLRAAGFEVEEHMLPDSEALEPIKRQLNVPSSLESCHTAVVEGYTIEGHVPADAIARLLEERPEALGIAVADMPEGSPGMEGPNFEPYDIMAFDAEGETWVFERRCCQR